MLVDGVIAIVIGVSTILRFVLRHAIMLLTLAVIIAFVGTIVGWWTP